MNREELLQRIFDDVTDVSIIGANLSNEITKYKDTLEILGRHNLQDLELSKKILMDCHFLTSVKIEVNHEIESEYVTKIKDIIRLNALGKLL